MFFGLFGSGKMKIELGKYNFSAGEAIQGKLNLKLKKPINARELSVSLIGEKRVRNRRYDRQSSSTTTERVYEIKIPIDGEKEYPAGQDLNYDFRIDIPQDTVSKSNFPAGGMAGAMGNVLSRMAGNYQIRWYVLGDLDVPKAFDVKKKIQVNIT